MTALDDSSFFLKNNLATVFKPYDSLLNSMQAVKYIMDSLHEE